MTDQHDVPALIAELRRLEAEATPGPWEVRDTYLSRRNEVVALGPRREDGSRGVMDVALLDSVPPNADGALIAAMRNALPTLLDIAERHERLVCAVRETTRHVWTSTSGRDGWEATLARALESVLQIAGPAPWGSGSECSHERALTEYKAQAEKLLCDAAESADPAGLLRAADMVPAQALRDLLVSARRRPGDGERIVAGDKLRALLPENAEASNA